MGLLRRKVTTGFNKPVFYHNFKKGHIMSNSTYTNVFSDGTTLHIPFPSKLDTYKVDHSRVMNEKQLQEKVDWLSLKPWVTEEYLHDFIKMAKEQW